MSVTSFNGRTGVVTLTSADVTSAFVAGSPTTGNLLEWNGTELADSGISAASVGTGTVTSITAGSGLSGGTITTTGTVSLNLANANTWTAQQQLNAGLVTQGQAAATISNVALTSNVVTVTTSAPHGFVAGQWVNVAAVTNTAINGTFPIASVTSTTFTYALTHANIASGADTGTAQVCEQVVLNASGAVQEYVLSTGQRVILTSSGQPFVIQNGTAQATLYHDGTYVRLASTSGALFLAGGSTGTTPGYIIFTRSGDGTGVNSPLAVNCGNANEAVKFRSDAGIGWSSSAVNVTTNADTGILRLAPNVIGPTNGTGGKGWLQDSAGTARITTPVTNATATLTNLSDLTITLIAGRKYFGRLVLFANNSQTSEGLQIGLGGGTATMTSIEMGFPSTPVGATLGTTNSTALATPLTATTVTTTDDCYVVEFSLVCNAGGTLIPQFAEASHLAGTATVNNGSLRLFDSPN